MNLRFFTTAFILTFFIFLSSCERPTEVNPNSSDLPPAIPANLNIYAAYDGEIGLDWDPSLDYNLIGYNIYRKTANENFKRIGFTSDNYFIDDSLYYDTTYYYKITALDDEGRESNFSNTASAAPKNIYAPESPRYLNINARNWQGKISIYLSWNNPTETDIAGYKVYRDTVSGFNIDPTKLWGFTKSNDFSDTLNLKFYKNYYYKVIAVDEGGLLSNPSSEVNDEILEIPELIFPKDNQLTDYFSYFVIKGVKVPAAYQVIIQTNEFFGEVWSKTLYSTTINDTIEIPFDANYINTDQIYYWRVSTYTNGNDNPNSVSKLQKFEITYQY